MAKIIMHGSHKGGCTKTAGSTLLAKGYHANNQRVLLLDLDHTMGTTERFLPKYDDQVDERDRKSIRWFLDGKYPIESQIVPSTLIEGIDVIPCESNVEGIIVGEEILRPVVEVLGNKYDYIIIDTHPHSSSLEVAGAKIADLVLTPWFLEDQVIYNTRKYAEAMVRKGMDYSKWRMYLTLFAPTTSDDPNHPKNKALDLAREQLDLSKNFSSNFKRFPDWFEPYLKGSKLCSFAKDKIDLAISTYSLMEEIEEAIEQLTGKAKNKLDNKRKF